MARRSRFERMVLWCRFHPKATAVIAVLVVVFAIAGAAAEDKKPGVDAALDTPGRPNGSVVLTPTPTASDRSGPSREAAGRSPAPSRITAAPADRKQRSDLLATTALAALLVKSRAPKRGYSRSEFGSAWTDDNDSPSGRNGCDARNDILRRDLIDETIKPGSNGCAVLAGTLRDQRFCAGAVIRHAADCLEPGQRRR